MSNVPSNKFREALDVLHRGRDVLMEELAETVLDQADDLLESGFAFHEFLENQGTRLHFLCLLLSQLEQSAELLDERQSGDCECEPEAEELPPPPIPEPPRPASRRRAPSPWEPPDEPAGDLAPPPERAPRRRTRSRAKKLPGQSSSENRSEDA